MTRTILAAVAVAGASFVFSASAPAAYNVFGPNPLLHAEARHCDISAGCQDLSMNWNPGDAPPARAASSALNSSSSADMHASPTDAEVKATASSNVAYDSSSADAELIDTITVSGPATVDLVGSAFGSVDRSDVVSGSGSVRLDAKVFHVDSTSCPGPDYVCGGWEYSFSLQRSGCLAVDSIDPSVCVAGAVDVPADLPAAGTYVVDVEATAAASDEYANAKADLEFHLEAPANVVVTSGSGLLPIQGGMSPATNTPAGSNVTVSPADATSGTVADVTFDNVTAAGNTSLTSSTSAPALPAGFQLVGKFYYELSTTASWSGTATVCFPYGGAMPRLLHYDSGVGAWVDVTDTSLSTASEVCGRVTSFSPFATAVVIPTVTSSTPTDGGSGVATSVAPTATFSQPMDATTITGATVTLNGPGGAVAATVAYNSSTNTLTLTPTSPLAPSTTYTMTLSTDIKSAGGASLAAPVSWSFTTAAPPDTVPPTLNLPASMATPATGPAGAVVTYSVTATDNVDPNPSVNCAPASGSTFAIGTTTVSCAASDKSGNTSHGSFAVTVKGAKDQLNALIQKVVNYTSLPSATKTLLIGSLQSLLANFDPSNATQKQLVCGALKLFIAAVQSMAGKTLPTSVANDWIADATRIRAVLACS